MRKPDWITGETLVDTTSHHREEIWVEEHENPDTGEKAYLVCDTSGCDGGLVGVYKDRSEAINKIGDMFGFDEFWVKE